MAALTEKKIAALKPDFDIFVLDIAKKAENGASTVKALNVHPGPDSWLSSPQQKRGVVTRIGILQSRRSLIEFPVK